MRMNRQTRAILQVNGYKRWLINSTTRKHLPKIRTRTTTDAGSFLSWKFLKRNSEKGVLKTLAPLGHSFTQAQHLMQTSGSLTISSFNSMVSTGQISIQYWHCVHSSSMVIGVAGVLGLFSLYGKFPFTSKTGNSFMSVYWSSCFIIFFPNSAAICKSRTSGRPAAVGNCSVL